MSNVTLVCLTAGKRKDGSGNWYKATILGHNAENMPVTKDFYLAEELGERLVRENIIENVPVNVAFGFNNYLNPVITGITRQGVSNAQSKEVK